MLIRGSGAALSHAPGLDNLDLLGMNCTAPPARHAVFVSHANPEDNEFATWLSLQLTQLGYTIWCDVVRFHGGEDFWHDIEGAIRDRTAKFLFVLSRSSNTKDGPLKELRVASITAARAKLKDFIVPLRIDDIPHGDMNIEVARLNAIGFDPNWASGLRSLLAKFGEDGVPYSPRDSTTAVSSWWREHRSAKEGVTQEPELHFSNWLQIESPPEMVFFHEVSRSGIGATLPEKPLPYPAAVYNNYLLSLAEARLLSPALPEPYEILRTLCVPFNDFAGQEWLVANIKRPQRHGIMTNLLRQSWDRFMARGDIRHYNLSGDRTCAFLRHVEGVTNWVRFVKSDGTKSFRGLTGYRTVMGLTPDAKRKRYWHFAVSARPMTHPLLGFALYAHVLFSDDGNNIWDDKNRLHSARRSQCSDWWNDDWRDRIMAFMTYLSDGSGSLALPAGDTALQVPIQPVAFSSPVNYRLAPATVSPYEVPETEAESDEELSDHEEYIDSEEGTIDA